MARALISALALVLVGCASSKPPTPFETGAETAPPYGCIEYRKRGGEC